MINLQTKINSTLGICIIIGLCFVTVFYYFTHRVEAVGELANISRDMTYNSALIKTNKGDFVIEFLPSKAPKTVENFIKLAKSGFYNGTKFHRTIKDFMIQGGDPYTKNADSSYWGMGGPGYTFADEINDQLLVRGVVAMANSGPNTNGSQFFVITAEQVSWLNGKHTAFAKVTKGMDVVDAISKVQTTGSPYDRPIDPIIVSEVVLQQ